MTSQPMLNLVVGKTYAMTEYPGPAGPLRTPIEIEHVSQIDEEFVTIRFTAMRFREVGTQTLELRVLQGDESHMECVRLDDPDRTVKIARICDGWLWTHFGTQFLDGPPDAPPDGTDVSIPALVRYY